MRIIRTKRYKTNVTAPSGLAICDFCGFYVNGNNLRKYFNYAGSPLPDYNTPNKFMYPTGDLMSSGDVTWNGYMVCPHCVDQLNGQSGYREPTADPYTADGNRPAPDFAAEQINTVLSTQSNQPLETESGILLGFA